MKIGYIGLGNMGAPMAINLAKAGCDITVYDLDENKISPVTQYGAKIGKNGIDVAKNVGCVIYFIPRTSSC